MTANERCPLHPGRFQDMDIIDNGRNWTTVVRKPTLKNDLRNLEPGSHSCLSVNTSHTSMYLSLHDDYLTIELPSVNYVISFVMSISNDILNPTEIMIRSL